jgi:O-antigen ligase
MFSELKNTFEINKHYLFLIYFLLLPFGGLYVLYTVLILILSCLFYKETLKKLSKNEYFYLFMLIWVPMAISLIDAINFEKSFIKTISVFPYLFVGAFLSTSLSIRKIYTIMSVMVAISVVWAADLFIYQLRVFELDKAILWRWSFSMGANFPGDDVVYYIPILGQVLSVLSAIIFESLRKFSDTKQKVFYSLCVFSIVVATIFYSGNRNAVLMLFFSFCIWFLFVGFKFRYFAKYPKYIAAFVLIITVIISFGLTKSSSRVTSFVNFDSMDLQTIDKLSSHRIPLWDAALNMARDNWVTGVGPRGFRYGFADYKPEKEKYLITYEESSTHPHFALLEIFLETGIVGFLGLFILFWYIFKQIKLLNSEAKVLLVPWFIALLTAIVPNMGKAFYSSYWLTFIIFLLIGCTAIININKDLETTEF